MDWKAAGMATLVIITIAVLLTITILLVNFGIYIGEKTSKLIGGIVVLAPFVMIYWFLAYNDFKKTK